MIHPQEALLQQGRALRQSTHYDEYRARRVEVEHRLARLVQLGLRQSRYFGRVKTRRQLYLAAKAGVDGENRLRSQCQQRPGGWNGQLRR